MRISRLRLQNFRGWAELDLRPKGHVLLAGVPRAGRTDIIAALARVLDPALIRVQPLLTDIRQQRVVTSSGSVDDTPAEQNDNVFAIAAYGEVEVTLVGLDSELEQLCDGFLEPIDDDDQIDETGDAAPDALLGIRIAYRVSYDPDTDALEHVLYFPAASNPTTAQYKRVPAEVRRSLPVTVLNSQRPLQLRAEGVLRRLVTDRDATAASKAFRTLELAVAAASDSLSAETAIAATVDAVLQAGGLANHLSSVPPTATSLRFRPEDGSLSALLRTVQPSLELDEAGLLSLTSHGSTATAVLAAAETLVLVSSVEGAIVLADDLGDILDVSAAEHLAAVLRSQSSQVWISTRRSEVARAFSPNELIRLVREQSRRKCCLVPLPIDKKEVALHRLLHAQLLPALTASAVVIVEGPHDLVAYTCADRYRAVNALPLAAAGVRIVSADNGAGGGINRIPRVAKLARSLGFRVISVIDGDAPKKAASVIPEIEAESDVVVQLPSPMAIELALLSDVDVRHLRTAATILPAYGVDDPTIGVADSDVQLTIAKFLHSRALHEQFLDALVAECGELPPVLNEVLDTIVSVANVNYSGPARVELAASMVAST